MTLRDLLRDLTTHPVPAIPVTGIACHSKQVRPGDLFIAVRGPNQDGHDYIEEAARRGACAIVVERQLGGRYLAQPVIQVFDTQQILPVVAARFYGRPIERLRLVGITGTCGKTTTAYLTKAMLEAADHRVGLFGTVAYEIGQRHLPSTNTTPGPVALQSMMAQMVEQGIGWCTMEVSSHALEQRRVDGLAFDAAVWTCLGSDHLDYHKTLEAYARAKRRIFSYLRPGGLAIINMDDAYGQTLAETLPHDTVVTYGVERAATVHVRVTECGWHGMQMTVESPWGTFGISTPLVGRYNASNIAAALTTCLALRVPPSAIQSALSSFSLVPGRLERVANDSGVHVVIDFAHTADALERALLAVRELVRGRLIVVFGCGGDRDQLKRPAMGKAAALLADHVVLTADNPRSEDPTDIMRQICAGFPTGYDECTMLVDREEAIHAALAMAKPEDAVLIAGKGHEAYQIFQHTAIPFSDRDVVARYFERSDRTVTTV